jgi:ubiquilin
MPITVHIRQGSGEQFDVTIEEDISVLDLKKACEEGSKLEAACMRLIYKGRILKDESSIKEFNIEDGQTVHLVKGKAAAGQAPTMASATSPAATTAASSQPAATANAGTGAAQPNPFAGMGMGGAMPGMGMPGMGMPGMGMPNMASGGGPSGMGGMGGMDPA